MSGLSVVSGLRASTLRTTITSSGKHSGGLISGKHSGGLISEKQPVQLTRSLNISVGSGSNQAALQDENRTGSLERSKHRAPLAQEEMNEEPEYVLISQLPSMA